MLTTRHKIVLGIVILLPTALVLTFAFILRAKLGDFDFDKAFESLEKKPKKKMVKTVKLDGMRLKMEIPQEKFKKGEKVKVKMTLKNTGNETKVLTYPSSQRFDISVNDKKDKEVWRWSDKQAFAMLVEEEEIKPGETESGAIVWKQKGTGGKQVPPGVYQIKGVTKANNYPEKVQIKIHIRKPE